jgi:hypothetical protein
VKPTDCGMEDRAAEISNEIDQNQNRRSRSDPEGGGIRTHGPVVLVADVPPAGVVPQPVEGILPMRLLRREHE